MLAWLTQEEIHIFFYVNSKVFSKNFFILDIIIYLVLLHAILYKSLMAPLCIFRQQKNKITIRHLEINSQVVWSNTACKIGNNLSNCTPGQARCLYKKGNFINIPVVLCMKI